MQSPAAAASRQDVTAELRQLARTAPEGYRTLARLQAAALKAEQGDQQGAAALWNDVATDTSADPLLRDLATCSGASTRSTPAIPPCWRRG